MLASQTRPIWKLQVQGETLTQKARWASELASQLKVPVTKSDNLSSIPGTHMIEKIHFQKLFFDLLLHTMIHMHTHK